MIYDQGSDVPRIVKKIGVLSEDKLALVLRKFRLVY